MVENDEFSDNFFSSCNPMTGRHNRGHRDLRRVNLHATNYGAEFGFHGLNLRRVESDIAVE